ncbi:Aspartic protease pep1 [Madurella mycetomatis]|uniref:Aspartic protease pep1 n=1 Tax=Madurella mycetomatis TaxID=100816 RepID=A0A175W9S6_9PEZI|nr:Aspartic protease pep1 [Madurella mycetomatis]KXX80558.1 Aspartic protease pep1 [Madurella mycetomatis]
MALSVYQGRLNNVQKLGKPYPQRRPVDNIIHRNVLTTGAQLFICALYSRKSEATKSFFTFGWIDQDRVEDSSGDILWATVDSSQGYWMFPSEYAMVNGKMIPYCGNKAVADTGTSITLVSHEVCDALGQIDSAFYSYSNQAFLVPMSIKPEQLHNFSIASRGQSTFDILGATFLRSIYAIWGQGNSRFGAVPKIEKPENSLSAPLSNEEGRVTKPGQ